MIHMRRHKTPKREAGTVLIIAISVLVMMTLVGVMVMQMVSIDLDAVGAERSGEEALFIAEAGIQWALRDIDLNYNINTTTPDWTPLQTTAFPGGTLIPVAADPVWGPGQIVGWGQLHPSSLSIPFGGGGFRVVVQPAAPPDNRTLLIRCLGTTLVGGRYGAKRMLEVAVSP